MKPSVEIVLPVCDENLQDVEKNVPVLIHYCRRSLELPDWRITLAINGRQTGGLLALARRIQDSESRLGWVVSSRRGKGSGILQAWTQSRAEIVCYMDIDLSTGLDQLEELLRTVENGAHLAIGSRFHPASKVRRTWLRTLISIVYHRIFLPRFMGVTAYTDAQCGFKAARREALVHLLPQVRNRRWFFDSELLYLAWLRGYRIVEIPVDYHEDSLSGVNLGQAILEFLLGSWALRRRTR